MKRITILFDDERIYQAVKAAAAREGRPVKDVVSEALEAWLSSRLTLSPEQRARRSAALKALDRLRASQPITNVVEDLLAETREEAS